MAAGFLQHRGRSFPNSYIQPGPGLRRRPLAEMVQGAQESAEGVVGTSIDYETLTDNGMLMVTGIRHRRPFLRHPER